MSTLVESQYYFPSGFGNVLDDVFKKNEAVWHILTNRKIIFEKLNGQIISPSANIGSYVELDGHIHIGENVVIGSSVKIKGPVIIGDNVAIEHGALIRPYTFIDNECSVGHGSEIKGTIMMRGAKVSSLAFVGDSVLGKKARVASGVVTANRRFDQRNIQLSFDSVNKIETEVDFFGCILGEGSRLGVNSITSPGTLIGANTFVDSLVKVSGYIPSEKFISINHEYKIFDNKFSGDLK
jgi:NDP-sugar pyrophosphorylase family protein